MVKKILFVTLFLLNVIGYAYANYRGGGTPLSLPATEEANSNLPLALVSMGSNDEKLYSTAQIAVSNVYPNPADDVISFDYTIYDLQVHAKIAVRNVLGVIVGEYDLSAHGSRIEIDASQLPTGVYFYTLSVNSKNVATKKFLVR
ncbi:MAG: T9SS type A sorting domain-containing protein [Thermoflexibacteraceae bacterium]